MPTRSRVRSEIQLRSTRLPNAPPNLGFPGMEKFALQSELVTSRRLRRRPQLCKRCVASARKRSYRSSLWFLFAELLETRIIPERIKHWIEPEESGGERHAKPESA